MRGVTALIAVLILAGCNHLPRLEELPRSTLTKDQWQPVEFAGSDGLGEAIEKAKLIRMQLDALSATYGQMQTETGDWTLAMAILGAGALAARLHPDALIGLGVAAAVPSLLATRYRPTDQFAAVNSAYEALTCQVEAAESLLKAKTDLLALHTGGSFQILGAFNLKAPTSSGDADAAKIFRENVNRLRHNLRIKQYGLITAVDYAATRDSLVTDMVAARQKAQEIRKTKTEPPEEERPGEGEGEDDVQTLRQQRENARLLAEEKEAEKTYAERMTTFDTDLRKCAADKGL